MQEKRLGMTWLKIYTGFFMLRIVGATIVLLDFIVSLVNRGATDTSLAMAILILLLAEYAFNIFTFVHFSKRTAFGYTINMVYIFLENLITGFNLLFERSLDQGDIAEQFVGIAITCVVLTLIWSIPNYIYFKNRKFLFSGTLKDKRSRQTQPVLTTSQKKAQEEAAAMANATATVNTKQTISKEAKPIEKDIPVDALKTLKELHEDGVLSDEEYAEKKKQILGI